MSYHSQKHQGQTSRNLDEKIQQLSDQVLRLSSRVEQWENKQRKISSEGEMEVTYKGGANPRAYIHWEEHMEAILSRAYLLEHEKVARAVSTLVDRAKSWWTQYQGQRRMFHESPIRTWKELKYALRREFLPECYIREQEYLLRYLVQGDLSVTTYYSKAKHALRTTQRSVNHVDTISWFIGGLQESIVDSLRSINHATLEEAARDAQEAARNVRFLNPILKETPPPPDHEKEQEDSETDPSLEILEEAPEPLPQPKGTNQMTNISFDVMANPFQAKGETDNQAQEPPKVIVDLTLEDEVGEEDVSPKEESDTESTGRTPTKDSRTNRFQGGGDDASMERPTSNPRIIAGKLGYLQPWITKRTLQEALGDGLDDLRSLKHHKSHVNPEPVPKPPWPGESQGSSTWLPKEGSRASGTFGGTKIEAIKASKPKSTSLSHFWDSNA